MLILIIYLKIIEISEDFPILNNYQLNNWNNQLSNII